MIFVKSEIKIQIRYKKKPQTDEHGAKGRGHRAMRKG